MYFFMLFVAQLKNNVMSVDFHTTEYARIVAEMKAEIEEYKEKLKRVQGSGGAVEKVQQAGEEETSLDPELVTAMEEDRKAEKQLLQVLLSIRRIKLIKN